MWARKHVSALGGLPALECCSLAHPCTQVTQLAQIAQWMRHTMPFISAPPFQQGPSVITPAAEHHLTPDPDDIAPALSSRLRTVKSHRLRCCTPAQVVEVPIPDLQLSRVAHAATISAELAHGAAMDMREGMRSRSAYSLRFGPGSIICPWCSVAGCVHDRQSIAIPCSAVQSQVGCMQTVTLKAWALSHPTASRGELPHQHSHIGATTDVAFDCHARLRVEAQLPSQHASCQ